MTTLLVTFAMVLSLAGCAHKLMLYGPVPQEFAEQGVFVDFTDSGVGCLDDCLEPAVKE